MDCMKMNKNKETNWKEEIDSKEKSDVKQKSDVKEKTTAEKKTTANVYEGKKKHIHILLYLSVAAICFLCLVGSSMAYLTDYDEKVNNFTVGKIDIELLEPNWVEADNQKILPTQIIQKDPQITNTGINDAFVYLKVSIPMRTVITADASGNRLQEGTAVNQELFTYTKNSNWTLLSKSTVGTDTVYTYSYDQILTAGSTTNSLFDTVVFANVVEGQIDENDVEIGISAYGIQTENTGDGSTSIPEAAKAAYDKYLKQNMNRDGAVVQ